MSWRIEAALFSMVGALSTALHFAVLVVMVRVFSVAPVPASTLGYILSAALNYRLNRKLTFRSERAHGAAVPRFIVVAAGGLLLNGLLMWLLHDVVSLHYIAAQVFATAASTVWNFIGNRSWTFPKDAR